MQKTPIDWPGLTHSVNPGYGCMRGCHYCYGRQAHNMRMKAKAAGKNLPAQYDKPWDVIQYFPDRMKKIPFNPKKPMKIFVGDCSDICYWQRDFMQKILYQCSIRPKIEFMFLTKDPDIYSHYFFPPNTSLGCTITCVENITDQQEKLNKMGVLSLFNRYSTFLSIEPLLGRLMCYIPTTINLVIVGMQTKPNLIPKLEWIKSIKHHNIHWKGNIKKYLTDEQLSNA